jgi:hypothetical protein
MRTQWPHSNLDERDERRESGHVGEQRMRTRYLPAERHETLPALAMRAEIHIGAFAVVRNSSAGAARALANSLEVNRQTGWRDNKLCRPARDICSCLHFIGGYPATSNKRTNGLIRNNKDAAGCEQWGQ